MGLMKIARYGKVHEKHGLSGTVEFRTWSDMFRRCYEPKCAMYKWYGARGIKIADEWRWFTNFWQDMGLRPSKQHSIDRIDNDKDYAPGNCRWATRTEQAHNISTNINITHEGKTLCASEWARVTGLSLPTILLRYHEGLPAEQILASARQWKMITWEGETMPYRTWARRKGIPETTFVRRITNGWPLAMVMADPETAAEYQMKRFFQAHAKKAQASQKRAQLIAEHDIKVSRNRSYEAALEKHNETDLP
jgi:hypothetical protein